jgi:uncharacterized protein (TIGR02996 family)
VLALLDAARDAPEDDTPRLALADWLEENGGEADAARAAFVRLQVELARTSTKDARRPGLLRRARRLQKEHEASWLGPLGEKARTCEFSRGLVHALVFPYRLYSRALTDWLGQEAGAWVEVLRVGTLNPPGMARFARFPQLAKSVTDLVVYGKFDPGVAATLLALPLRRLRKLRLGACGLGETDARTLAAAPLLGQLTALDLSGNGIGDGGAAALAGSPSVAGLTALKLTANGITAAGARALAASPHVANLRHLDLGNNYLTEEGACALAASPFLANLTSLSLWFTAVGSEGAAALAASPHLGGLTELKLTANGSLRRTPGAAALRHRFGDRVRF